MPESSIKLLHGDCLELMKDIPDKSINMVLCDLPYGLTACKWDIVIPFALLWEQYLRICCDNSIYCFTASNPFASLLIASNVKMYKHEWVWIKNAGSNFMNTVREPFKEHELVVVFSNGKWTYNKQMQKRSELGENRVKSNVRFKTESDNYRKFKREETKKMPVLRVPSSWQKFNRERGLHPTQKPVALLEYLIRTYTRENEIVLDNCMGSGSTGVACINTNRKFIGMEKDDKYFEIAKNRIDKALFEIGKNNA